jgi:biotin transporter BioY
MDLLQEMERVSVPSGATAKCRVLWLSLARLTRQTGSAMYRTYGFFILYMFMKITLNVYWTTNVLLFVPSQLFVIIYIIISIVNDVVLMYVVCDSAQLVKQKVTY